VTHKISVEEISTTKYRVTVIEGKTKTTHDVTLTGSDLRRYAAGRSPESLLEVSFEFLLQREPQESILRQFTLSDVERYFPDYPKIIRALPAVTE